MARQKKCYSSIIPGTATHQSRGGGTTVRLNHTHRYPTRPVEEAPYSPSYIRACAAKRLKP